MLWIFKSRLQFIHLSLKYIGFIDIVGIASYLELKYLEWSIESSYLITLFFIFFLGCKLFKTDLHIIHLISKNHRFMNNIDIWEYIEVHFKLYFCLEIWKISFSSYTSDLRVSKLYRHSWNWKRFSNDIFRNVYWNS